MPTKSMPTGMFIGSVQRFSISFIIYDCICEATAGMVTNKRALKVREE
jgi:hypothetical protein